MIVRSLEQLTMLHAQRDFSDHPATLATAFHWLELDACAIQPNSANLFHTTPVSSVHTRYVVSHRGFSSSLPSLHCAFGAYGVSPGHEYAVGLSADLSGCLTWRIGRDEMYAGVAGRY